MSKPTSTAPLLLVGWEDEPHKPLPEIRCRRCRRLLMKGKIKHVQIKCPKCGWVQYLSHRD